MTVLHFMTTSHNFALKIETSWAKKVAKSNLETRNVNDVYSFSDKKLKKVQCKIEKF